MTRVALDLSFETMGSGPPLMVLHGLFGSRGNWRGMARELAASHTVYTVDLRNHGASPWANSMSYAEMADDVLHLILFLGLERVTLMGHSMGGKVAMALALRDPGKVGDLVVVDIAPVSYADTLTPFARAMQGADVMTAASRSEVQRRLQQLVPDQGVVPFLMQNLVMQNDHFDWRLNLPGIASAMSELCAFPAELSTQRFDGRVTVIAGEHSDYVSDREGSAFRPMFSRVSLDVVKDAGHWVHADQPQVFLERVRHALQPNTKSAALRRVH